ENRNKASSPGNFDSGLPENGLAVWWVNTGAFFGWDDIRLVDASKPDQDPNGTTAFDGAAPGYINQGAGALFKDDPTFDKRLLIDNTGGWSLLYFWETSAPGDTVFVNF